jgi:hypothetical protein
LFLFTLSFFLYLKISIGVSLCISKNKMSGNRALFAVPKPRLPKRVPEWRLQAAVVSEFHKWQDAGWPFEFAGDMGAGKRNGTRAKVTGLKAGEPDLRLFMAGGVLKMIELKAKGGSLSKEQKERHVKLRALGFEVRTVTAETSESAAKQCSDLLGNWLVDGVVRL